jgi:hypothetical protein
MYETTEVASFNIVKIYGCANKKKLKFAPPLPTMPIQLATTTLTTRHPDNSPL